MLAIISEFITMSSTIGEEHYEDVWALPFRSQEFMEGPQAQQTHGELRLRLDHETESGQYRWTVLVFFGVHALSFTGHASCSPGQIRAYDRLVQVMESPWLDSLEGRPPELHHYRVYFDEIGCYDVAATRISVTDES